MIIPRSGGGRQQLVALCLALLATLYPLTAALAQNCPLYPSPHQRMGFNVAPDGGLDIHDYDAARLGAGWYHNYGVRKTPQTPGGIQHHQMVHANINTTNLPASLGPTVDANPGAIWILGNEPDRYGQDGVTAAQYAVFFHEVYTFLKARDPSSRIAIGGVVQPTPLRLRYLDLILTEYQQRYGVTMPVEIWDIHNFILPENCYWGASIPPGLEAYQSEGKPCDATLNEHGNITIFKQQIRTFRQWMKDRGFRQHPLMISEYGILLSKYHGYDYARVRNFMTASFDYMLNTTDPDLGYTADGNRLVQEFAWFSLNYWEFNINTYFGLNGNLFDHDSRQIMPLGLDYANYTKKVTVQTIDLTATNLQVVPDSATIGQPINLSASFFNQGALAATDVAVRFWLGDPRNGGQLIGSSAPRPQVLTGCHRQLTDAITWSPTAGGAYTLFAELYAGNLAQESNLVDNYRSEPLVVIPLATTQLTPSVTPAEPPTLTATPTVLSTAPTATSTITPAVTPTVTPTLLSTAPTATPAASPTPTPTLLVIATATLVATTSLTPSFSPTPLPTATLSLPTEAAVTIYLPLVVR